MIYQSVVEMLADYDLRKLWQERNFHLCADAAEGARQTFISCDAGSGNYSGAIRNNPQINYCCSVVLRCALSG